MTRYRCKCGSATGARVREWSCRQPAAKLLLNWPGRRLLQTIRADSESNRTCVFACALGRSPRLRPRPIPATSHAREERSPNTTRPISGVSQWGKKQHQALSLFRYRLMPAQTPFRLGSGFHSAVLGDPFARDPGKNAAWERARNTLLSRDHPVSQVQGTMSSLFKPPAELVCGEVS